MAEVHEATTTWSPVFHPVYEGLLLSLAKGDVTLEYVDQAVQQLDRTKADHLGAYVTELANEERESAA